MPVVNLAVYRIAQFYSSTSSNFTQFIAASHIRSCERQKCTERFLSVIHCVQQVFVRQVATQVHRLLSS